MSRKFKKSKKRGHSFRARLTYCITSITLILLCSAVYYFSRPTNHPQNSPTPISQPSSPKAAIVDQLSIFLPNQSFVRKATTILENAGFNVDYHRGENVTVEFYRYLPQQGYSFIVMRVHSGIEYSENQTTGNVDIFTSEPYDENKASTTYFWEAIDDRLVRVFFTEEGSDYFGISPKFVESSMIGRFSNTTIIMMGCDGLRPGYITLAKAFVKKGAKIYISWTGPVTAAHSDGATLRLLQAFVTERQTIKNAIITTMNAVGSDPAFRSQLICYPVKEQDYIMQTTASNDT